MIQPYAIPGLRDKRSIKTSHIENAVFEYLNISRKKALSESREKLAVKARYYIYYLLRTVMKLGVVEIGLIYSTDHTTVVHGSRKITFQLEVYEDTRSELGAIISMIESKSNVLL